MEVAGRLTFRGVLQRAGPIARQHPIGFAVVTLAGVFVPSLWGFLLSDAIEDALIPDTTNLASKTIDAADSVFDLVPDALSGIEALLLAGVVIHAAVSDARGAPVPFSASFRAGLANFPRNLAITLVTAVASTLASVVFVAPALKVLTAWSVVIPVAMAERPRFIAGFRRSAALTRGDRWLLLGFIVLFLAGYVARDVVEDGVTDWLDLDGVPTWALAVVGAASQAALAVWAAACWAAVYLELIWIKEGAVAARVIAAFA